MRNSAVLILITALFVMIGCTSPDNDDDSTGPSPTLTLSVEAQPPTIPADGESRLVIFTEVRNGENPVSDSTEVVLLNSIGSLTRGIVYTHGGVALDTLTSDTTAGIGWVIAYTQGERDSVEVFFTQVE